MYAPSPSGAVVAVLLSFVFNGACASVPAEADTQAQPTAVEGAPIRPPSPARSVDEMVEELRHLCLRSANSIEGGERLGADLEAELRDLVDADLIDYIDVRLAVTTNPPDAQVGAAQALERGLALVGTAGFWTPVNAIDHDGDVFGLPCVGALPPDAREKMMAFLAREPFPGNDEPSERALALEARLQSVTWSGQMFGCSRSSLRFAIGSVAGPDGVLRLMMLRVRH